MPFEIRDQVYSLVLARNDPVDPAEDAWTVPATFGQRIWLVWGRVGDQTWPVDVDASMRQMRQTVALINLQMCHQQVGDELQRVEQRFAASPQPVPDRDAVLWIGAYASPSLVWLRPSWTPRRVEKMGIELRGRFDDIGSHLRQAFDPIHHRRGDVPRALHYLVLCLARHIVEATPGPITWQQAAWQPTLACIDLVEITVRQPTPVDKEASTTNREEVAKAVRHAFTWYLKKRRDFLGVVLRHGVGAYRICSGKEIFEVDVQAMLRREPAIDEPGISPMEKNARTMRAARMWERWDERQVEGQD